MIIDLTYACKMGCSHCISDCKPEGENMSLQQLSFSYKNVSLLKYPLLTRSKHRRVLLGNQPSQDTGWGLKQRNGNGIIIKREDVRSCHCTGRFHQTGGIRPLPASCIHI